MHTFYEDKNVQLSVFCFPFGIFCFPPTEGFIKYFGQILLIYVSSYINDREKQVFVSSASEIM